MTQQPDGFVYVQTNDADHNEVVVFARGAGGELERRNSYLTGGKGSGEPHLPSQSSVLVDGNRLFVTNAGSDDVTVFSIDGDRLEVLDRIASGGSAPRSVAVHAGGHVYVLNTGDEPNITGFELVRDRLVAIKESTQPAGTDPAQVAFSRDGRTLLVSDRADSIHAFSVGRRWPRAAAGYVPVVRGDALRLRPDGGWCLGRDRSGRCADRQGLGLVVQARRPGAARSAQRPRRQHTQRGLLGGDQQGRPDRVRDQLRRRHDLDVRHRRGRQHRASRSRRGHDGRRQAGHP